MFVDRWTRAGSAALLISICIAAAPLRSQILAELSAESVDRLAFGMYRLEAELRLNALTIHDIGLWPAEVERTVEVEVDPNKRLKGRSIVLTKHLRLREAYNRPFDPTDDAEPMCRAEMTAFQREGGYGGGPPRQHLSFARFFQPLDGGEPLRLHAVEQTMALVVVITVETINQDFVSIRCWAPYSDRKMYMLEGA